MGAGLAILIGIGLVALAAGSGGRRRGITTQTRDRVRETLATPDTTARTLPVDSAPAPVDPDRRSSATTTTSPTSPSTSSGGGSAWARSRGGEGGSADMTFRVDANGRYPGEPGYEDPDVPRGAPASMHIIPPGPEDHGTEGDGATERPSTRNPEEARRLASGTASAIRTTASGWRNRLRAFQRAAGIPVDGRYGGLSYNALVYYGIRNPPPARSAPRPSAPEANYVDRVITAGTSVAGWSGRR